MKSLFTICLWTCVYFCFSQSKVKIGDVEFGEKIQLANEELVLNGGGVREKFWIDIYSIGLYTFEKSTNGHAIAGERLHSSSLRLVMVSSLVDNDNLNEAIEKGFQRVLGNKIADISKDLAIFKRAFKEGIFKGDILDFNYIPEQGLKVIINGVEKCRIESFLFKKSLFLIWLGDNYHDQDLQDNLLGKS